MEPKDGLNMFKQVMRDWTNWSLDGSTWLTRNQSPSLVALGLPLDRVLARIWCKDLPFPFIPQDHLSCSSPEIPVAIGSEAAVFHMAGRAHHLLQQLCWYLSWKMIFSLSFKCHQFFSFFCGCFFFCDFVVFLLIPFIPKCPQTSSNRFPRFVNSGAAPPDTLSRRAWSAEPRAPWWLSSRASSEESIRECFRRATRDLTETGNQKDIGNWNQRSKCTSQ